MSAIPLVLKCCALVAAICVTEGLIFDSPHPCNPSESNSYIVGPQCSTGNVTSKRLVTMNFYNHRIGNPMKVCFSKINNCRYSFGTSCDRYVLPPSYLIITDTTGGTKQSAIESGNEKCTHVHSGTGISVVFDFTALVYADVLMRYRIL